MLDDARLTIVKIRGFWEILFSLHIGTAVATIVLMVCFSVAAFFSRMECRIKILVHVEQTDLVYGHLTVWIPSVLAAVLLLIVLHASARTHFGQKFLQSAAGIMTICTPIVVSAVLYQTTAWPAGWLCLMALLEIVTAVVIALRTLSWKWRMSPLASVLLLAVHFVFWYGAAGSTYSTRGYGGPGGPILGFFSSMAWCLYVSRLGRAETNEKSHVS